MENIFGFHPLTRHAARVDLSHKGRGNSGVTKYIPLPLWERSTRAAWRVRGEMSESQLTSENTSFPASRPIPIISYVHFLDVAAKFASRLLSSQRQ